MAVIVVAVMVIVMAVMVVVIVVAVMVVVMVIVMVVVVMVVMVMMVVRMMRPVTVDLIVILSFCDHRPVDMRSISIPLCGKRKMHPWSLQM